MYISNLTFLTEKEIKEKKNLVFGLKGTNGTSTGGYQNIIEIFNTTTKCFQEETAIACVDTCKQQQLLENCGCIEKQRKYFDLSTPICFFGTYISKPNCQWKKVGENEYVREASEPLAKCEEFCNTHPTCFRRFTRFKKNFEFELHSCYFLPNSNQTCHLELRMLMDDEHFQDPYTYKQYEMRYKITRSEFLSNLGGTLDLWIGISVIGLVHLVIFIIKQIIYISFRKKVGTVLTNWQQLATIRPADSSTIDVKIEDDNDNLDKKLKKLTQRVAQLEHQNNDEEREFSV